MAAKANLIMTNDIQVTAREIDFVTRFERNWEHLREILGIMRSLKKTERLRSHLIIKIFKMVCRLLLFYNMGMQPETAVG